MAFESKDPWKVTLTDTGSNNYTYTSQAMEDAVEKYKNDPEILSRIRSIVRSFNYTPGAFDPLLRLFHGDPLEKMKAEYALNADNALSEIINNAETRNYNSEAAQASRMEAAGMNADLLGIGDASAQQMTPPDETLPNPAGAYESATQQLQAIGQGALQIPQMAMQIASGIQGLQLGQQEILGKQLTNFFGSFDSVENIFDTLYPMVVKGKDDNGGDMITFLNRFADGLPRQARNFLKSAGLTGSSMNSLSLLNALVGSEKLNSKRSSRAAGRVGDFWDIVEGMSNSNWNDDLYSFIDDFAENYGIFTDYVFEFQKELSAKGIDIEMLKAGYDWDRWKELNGKTAAEAENMQNEAAKASKQYDEKENQFWNGLLSNMPKGWFGQLLTLGVMFLRANASQGFHLPAISSGNSSGKSHSYGERHRNGGFNDSESSSEGSWFSFRP